MLKLLLSLLVLSVVEVTSDKLRTYPKQSVFILKSESNEGEADLHSNKFELSRKDITHEQSMKIQKCTRNTGSFDIESLAMPYMRCVEHMIGELSGNTTGAKWCQECTQEVKFGQEMEPDYKMKVVDKLKEYGLGIEKNYNQLPLFTNGEKPSNSDESELQWQCDYTKNVAKNHVDIKNSQITQQSAEVANTNSTTKDYKASLELSYKWLSLNVDVGHKDTSTDTRKQLTGELTTTALSLSYDVADNKTIFFRDGSVHDEIDRDIYLPYEASGWLVDVEFTAIASCNSFFGCDRVVTNKLKRVLLFPLGDMASFEFARFTGDSLKKINANTMIVKGPKFPVTGYKTEYIYHLKESARTCEEPRKLQPKHVG